MRCSFSNEGLEGAVPRSLNEAQRNTRDVKEFFIDILERTSALQAKKVIDRMRQEGAGADTIAQKSELIAMHYRASVVFVQSRFERMFAQARYMCQRASAI